MQYVEVECGGVIFLSYMVVRRNLKFVFNKNEVGLEINKENKIVEWVFDEKIEWTHC